MHSMRKVCRRSSGGNQTLTLQVFAEIFFPDSCCWKKCLPQQQHDVLLTTKWHWGRHDDKVIGTWHKHVGGVSAIFYPDFLFGILFGVTFNLFGFDPQIDSRWIYFLLFRARENAILFSFVSEFSYSNSDQIRTEDVRMSNFPALA